MAGFVYEFSFVTKLNHTTDSQNKYRLILPVIGAVLYLIFLCFTDFDATPITSFLSTNRYFIGILNYLGLIAYSDVILTWLGLVLYALFFGGLEILAIRVMNDLSVSYYERRKENLFCRALDAIVSQFYDEDREEIYLQKALVIFRQAVWWFTVVFGIVCILFLFLPWLLMQFGVRPLTILDVFPYYFKLAFPSFMVVYIFYAFLSGDVEEIKPRSFSTSHVRSEIVSDYEELANTYKETFPLHFVNEIIQPFSDLNEQLTPEQIDNIYIKKNRDNKAVVEVLTTIKNNLQKNYRFNTNRYFIEMLLALFENKNVAINASIFSEVFLYILRYLDSIIADGNTVLIVARDKKQCREIKRFISKEQYEKIDFLDNRDVWNIDLMEEDFDTSKVDILIATPQEIVNNTKIKYHNDFMKDLKTVLVLNSQEMVSQNAFIPMIMGWKINNESTNTIQYLFLMEHTFGSATDAFRHAFSSNRPIEILNDVKSQHGQIFIELWKNEADIRMQDEWLSEGAHNFYGSLMTLAAFGTSVGEIIQAYVTANSVHSYEEARENMISDGNSFNDYKRMLEAIKIGYLDSVIRHQSFMVTDDFIYNLPLMIRMASEFFAEDSTMIHIVSKPYLLRDYFFSLGENIKRLNHSYQLVPFIEQSKQNTILSFLYKAYNVPVSEKEIQETVGRNLFPGERNFSTQDVLLEALKRAKNDRFLNEEDVYENFRFIRHPLLKNGEFVENYDVEFINSNLYHQITAGTQRATLDILNYDRPIELDYLSVQIPQNFIVGQLLVAEGRTYLIQSINERDGVIKVVNMPYYREAPTYIQEKTFYLDQNDETFMIKLQEEQENTNAATSNYLKRLSKTLFSLPSEIVVSGYTAIDESNTFKKGTEYFLLDEKIRRPITYTEGLCLSYEVNLPKDRIDAFTTTLAVLIQELLKTLFPYIYQYLSVIPIAGDVFNHENLTEHYLSKKFAQAKIDNIDAINGSQHYNVNILILEDSLIDLGGVETMYYNTNLIYRILNDYLNWFLSQLNQEREEEQPFEPYLFYGEETLPTFFELDEVKELVQDLNTLTIQSIDQPKRELKSHHRCSFCDREISGAEWYSLEDGRIACQSCYLVNSQEHQNLLKIYQEIRKFMYDYYHIPEEELPKDINVRFESAAAIKNRLKLYSNGPMRVLGFAASGTRELWIETGSPEMIIRTTLIHELTHFWQYENINMNHPALEDNVLIEGHASYVETEYLRENGHINTYNKKKNELEGRQDEYGEGFRILSQRMERENNKNIFDFMRAVYGNKH